MIYGLYQDVFLCFDRYFVRIKYTTTYRILRVIEPQELLYNSNMLIVSLAVLIRIFSNSLANVFQKQLTARGVCPILVTFLMYAGLSLFLFPFAFGINWTAFGYQFWVSAVIGGLFGALGNFYLVKALEQGELSVLGPINAYKSVVAMVFGIFLLREIPSVVGIFAVALIIWGSYFIFDTQEEGFSFKLLKRKDIRYRIYALIFTAIEAVFIKNVISFSDVNTSFIMWSFWGMVFSGGSLCSKKVGSVVLGKFEFLRLGLVILFMGLMQYFTNIVFLRIPVGYGLALFQISAILSVILGWKYFNECHIKKKLLGSMIMTIGAILLILFK